MHFFIIFAVCVFLTFARCLANHYPFTPLSTTARAKTLSRRPVRSGAGGLTTDREGKNNTISSAVYPPYIFVCIYIRKCVTPYRRRAEENTRFPAVYVLRLCVSSIYLFSVFFCLNVDSPSRSGGPPAAAGPRLIYWCVLHTETLSSVHWRLKHTRTKYYSLPPYTHAHTHILRVLARYGGRNCSTECGVKKRTRPHVCFFVLPTVIFFVFYLFVAR